jgi:hypothetical protein
MSSDVREQGEFRSSMAGRAATGVREGRRRDLGGSDRADHGSTGSGRAGRPDEVWYWLVPRGARPAGGAALLVALLGAAMAGIALAGGRESATEVIAVVDGGRATSAAERLADHQRSIGH